MGPGISIKRLYAPDEDGSFQVDIKLSNGECSTVLTFWSYGSDLNEFGERLSNFPRDKNDTVRYALGEDKDTGPGNLPYYLLLHVFCFEPTGESAIRVVVDNYASGPDHHRSEFYIKSFPASLNKLGQALRNWNPTDVEEIDWIPNSALTAS